jgi:NDP-sugar pyrophosphorylase family protein
MVSQLLKDVTAVLLCGGKGERLRPFTEDWPKPMVPVRGQPLLAHLLRYLSSQAIERFVLCTGYKAEAIDTFVQGHPLRSRIVTVNSGDAMMMDRVREALPDIPDRGLVCYGDTLANVDLAVLAREHRDHHAQATVTLYPLQSPFGVVKAENSTGRVTSLREKPILPFWINIGFILCERPALELAQPGTDIMFFLEDLLKRGVLYAHRHRGRHVTVNTAKEHSDAEAEVDFFTVLEGQ